MFVQLYEFPFVSWLRNITEKVWEQNFPDCSQKYNWDTVEYVGMSTASWPLEFGNIS